MAKTEPRPQRFCGKTGGQANFRILFA